ncbi:MAG: ATP-dependent zinc metalloprotease FtsH [Patescibacteria group bacterium]|nr:ATP-dependent zinc metalloprotease FtsH [Patescibacteria group bacterium]
MAKQIGNMKKNEKKSGKDTQRNIAEFKFNFDLRTVFIAIFVFFLLLTLYGSFSGAEKANIPEKPLTQVLTDIRQDRVKSVEVDGNTVNVVYKNGQNARATKESTSSFLEILANNDIPANKVPVTVKDTEGSSVWAAFLINIVPTILIVAFLFFLFRQARGAQDSVFSFGQSRAKRFSKDTPKVTFKDIAGIDEAKQEIAEVVDFLKHPAKYKKVGARTPKGVMLVGPAGTGKTLLAKAVAGEAGTAFFSIAGSEFMEMLVGIGAARVRDLFATAKRSAPAIIFIDEIDAIGRARSNGVMPAHDEREQTLNQILVEMDGFTPNEQVVVLAATNRGDLLDPALLRPGRFDRRIVIDYPNVEGRKAILAIHARGKPFDESVNWDRVAARTVGFSGADLENMLNEAAIQAAREGLSSINSDHIEEAATKVKLGPEKRRLQTEEDKQITAYHEAGHAICSHYLHQTDQVSRISIVSRGMALGFTLIPPATDQLHITKSNLMGRIAVMMGGRAAEELVFNEATTGAANDFSQATRIARAMVMDYGMSPLGPVNYDVITDITDSSRPVIESQNISQEMLAKIDAEIRKIIEECYGNAIRILTEHRAELDTVAQKLVEKENMDQDEFERIVGKKPTKEGKKPEISAPVKLPEGMPESPAKPDGLEQA